jgi:type III restriction enzyme
LGKIAAQLSARNFTKLSGVKLKLKFKQQAYQTHAVESVVKCFAGQPYQAGISYRLKQRDEQLPLGDAGFGNAEIQLAQTQILENIKTVQRAHNIPISSELIPSKTGKKEVICSLNLDIEMETGTGKTYCYIKTIFELNKLYGWSKFIIVVPSIAIREGVYKSLKITAAHFLETYNKKARFFIYNSKQLHNLEAFASDSGINIMVINVQAFNATGKDNRRIYEELDDFQSRQPIEVISQTRPILILDEPQKMEGAKTLDSLQAFHALATLRYSATHKTTYNKIHRLDALDAYTQKLVKKIGVRGITIKGLTGTTAYLYFEAIQTSDKPPIARLELEIKQKNGIKRIIRKVEKNGDLFELSNQLDQYKGFVVADINANTGTMSFTNGVELKTGEATGDTTETTLRRIQISQTIKAHFEKEQALFQQGIKVLSLFFIDEVAKYRLYDENGEQTGEYAKIFEEEYTDHLKEVLTTADPAYSEYLREIEVRKTHNGYFSIDKKTKRLKNPETGKKSTETDDTDAYNLILKDKERLLSFDEPTRFIFSHSALREGWDNPNVFVICTLKHSDNSISRRQEVGRGLRLAVNKHGERMDDPATVHEINRLTVVTNESYADFVSSLQKEMSAALSERPRVANAEYFTNKVLKTNEGNIAISADMANDIEFYLIQSGYVDKKRNITEKYHEAKKAETLAPLPAELAPYSEQVFLLVDSVYSDIQLPNIDDELQERANKLNDNFYKKEFIALWNSINRKATYTVKFDSSQLVANCITALNKQLQVTKSYYTVQRGEQKEEITYAEIKNSDGFKAQEHTTEYFNHSVHSTVKYDLIGKLVEGTKLTRQTVAQILAGIEKEKFEQYHANPEDFIAKASTLINEQKATQIIERISYNLTDEVYDSEIFTKPVKLSYTPKSEPLKRHIYDYVSTDSETIEKPFAEVLDTMNEVEVYAKLPKAFFIPTPVGNYTPDWAIAFKEGKVKHIYFIAETKGSLSSLELRTIEECKIKCAEAFFEKITESTNGKVKYKKISNYEDLLQAVNPSAVDTVSIPVKVSYHAVK